MRLLPPQYVAKPWGVEGIQSEKHGLINEKIGEIWHPAPAPHRLLAKRIYTSENLSIQVHPDDEYAQKKGHPAGKSECWFLTKVAPGARLAAGTQPNVTADQLKEAAIEGTICDLLQWHDAAAGHFFYIPAGTIHAIGAGIELIEIQQNVDVTYRLYDYGRGRDLHLDDGFAVATPQPLAEDCQTKNVFAHDRLLALNTQVACATIVRTAGQFVLEAFGGELIVCVSGVMQCNGEPLPEHAVFVADPDDLFVAHNDLICIVAPPH